MYTPTEFSKKMVSRGLANRIKDVKAWMETTGRTSFGQEDFEVAYHWIEYERYVSRPSSNRDRHLLTSDGQDMSSPSAER